MADGTTTDTQEPQARQTGLRDPRVRIFLAKYGLLIVFLLVVIAFKALKPDVFLTADNLRRTILSPTGFTPLMILSIGLTFVLVMGDFDLSFGQMVGLAGGAAAALMVNFETGWVVALLVVFLIAIAVGITNGFLVAKVGASSFIITLATASILLGLETLWTDKKSIIGIEDGFYLALDETSVIWQLRLPFFFAIGIGILAWLVLDKTELGRYMYAIGGNREAARLAGIPVVRLRTLGFIIVAVSAAFVGVLLTANLGGTRLDLGTGFLLDAYAAVFLGAAVFRPGQFNIPGTIVGVLFLRVVEVGLLVQQIENAWINIAKGAILVFGVLLSQLVARRR